MFSIKHDKEARAVYIYASKKKIATTQEISSNCLVDLDKAGNIVGMEILGVKSVPKKNEVQVVLDIALSR